MAFERFSINRGSMAERPGVYGVDPGSNPFTPRPRGPLPDLPNAGRGNGLPTYTGPSLPGMGGSPASGTGVAGTPWTPPAFGSGALGGSGNSGSMGGGGGGGGNSNNGMTAKQRFQQAFDGWLKNGAKGVFAGFPGDAVLSRGFNNRGGGAGGGGGGGKKPPATNKPPTTSTPLPPAGQWGNPTAPFPQNPYDVPNPLQPVNNPWLASLPQRDWMTMPSASPGYDQAPPPFPWRPPY